MARDAPLPPSRTNVTPLTAATMIAGPPGRGERHDQPLPRANGPDERADRCPEWRAGRPDVGAERLPAYLSWAQAAGSAEASALAARSRPCWPAG